VEALRQLRVAEEFVRRLSGAVQSNQLYATHHPIVRRAVQALSESVVELLAEKASMAIGVVGDEIVVGDTPLPHVRELMSDLRRRLRTVGIERIAIERGVTPDQLDTLAYTLAHPDRAAGSEGPGAEPADPLGVLGGLPHIKVGRLAIEERVTTSAADVITLRRLYGEATGIAESVWDAASHEGAPDPLAARALVDSLAQAVSQNRTAILALAALKHYDNYTFTHMVNVSILTMGQARALGIDGSLLRELGVAALMHDIGKVRTPSEILQKPDRLTGDETRIMRLHVVDGAEMLRRTPDVPALAPIVAFEHHLRLDGTGYPAQVARGSLNLATMLCSIADVFDAMRSQRVYQAVHPTDRILAVLKHAEGQHFDRHLVRRFGQLLGVYPPGCLVRLTSGAIAVVLRVHAPDPYRPRVRMILSATGERLPTPVDLNLWEAQPEGEPAVAVKGPVDSAEVGVDPLTYL